MAPVLQITPELQKSCEDSSVVPVVLPTELGSVEALAVASTPSMGSGGEGAPNSEALFATELCGLLACLEATSPGYGKDIACVVTGTSSDSVFMKMEKSLRRRARKNLVIVRKASAFLDG